jgi:hypothetical protein
MSRSKGGSGVFGSRVSKVGVSVLRHIATASSNGYTPRGSITYWSLQTISKHWTGFMMVDRSWEFRNTTGQRRDFDEMVYDFVSCLGEQ